MVKSFQLRMAKNSSIFLSNMILFQVSLTLLNILIEEKILLKIIIKLFHSNHYNLEKKAIPQDNITAKILIRIMAIDIIIMPMDQIQLLVQQIIITFLVMLMVAIQMAMGTIVRIEQLKMAIRRSIIITTIIKMKNRIMEHKALKI